MTPLTSIFWKAVYTSFSQFFPAKSRLPTLLHGRVAIFTWKKPLSLSEIIIPMKSLSRILPDMSASTEVTFIPCFKNISIPHRRTIFLPAGSRVRSSFYRIRISPSKRVAFSCGYRNAEVFTKAFRQKQGMTPSAIGKSSALTRLLTLHMFRDLSDFIITKSFFHEQEEMLWKTVKMLDGVS